MSRTCTNLSSVRLFSSQNTLHANCSDRFGYAKENIVVLADDTQDPNLLPTKANIIKYMNWLVADAGYDDALYFH